MKNLLSSFIITTALIKKGNFTMKFTKNHQIVISWVNLVNAGIYTFDRVPNLFNLRKVVKEVLDEQAGTVEEPTSEPTKKGE